MLALSCIVFIVDHYFLFDVDNVQVYNEWFNYIQIVPLILALGSYVGLLWRTVSDGIKKKKIYDYGDKRPLYATKLTVQLLFGCSILGCFCIILSLVCFLLVSVTSMAIII